ncbi:hypothetical protein DEDE109153_06395 [Deinococcus deserti]|uniref:Uncharacterized protein n=1 Tax=Deinococcus deserti (strain DSM 17065 / CIP 109153 / LMG 22923 / VCD115) TaxID=546414 RepID=C1CZH5_DEIDV|nr:hypothetical protein [Deinococcus deserti]ACO47223.1 Conserved hypothetical protein, precursor; putative membrane protein [Deinococcus deserti VCD115]
MLNTWQGRALQALCVAGLGPSVACGVLLWKVAQAWQTMPAETRELGLSPVPIDRMLPQLILLGLLTSGALVLAVMNAALLVWLRSLLGREHTRARQLFSAATWAVQLLLVLVALAAVGWQLWSVGRPESSLGLLPPGVYALITSFVMVMVGLPLLLLTWLCMAGFRRWLTAAGRWINGDQPREALHRPLGRVSDTLTYGAFFMLGLGMYLTPAPLVELMFTPGVTALERELAGQKPAMLGLMMWLLLLGGVSLWVWRTTAQLVSDALNPQVSRIARLARARHEPAEP